MGCKIGALKLLIVVPNIIFFASGCFMIGVGAYAISRLDELTGKAGEENYHEFITGGSVAVLVAGMLQCVVSFCGVCGALADKRGMLKGYSIILGFIILLQIVAVIMAFVCANKLEELATNNGVVDIDFSEAMKKLAIGIVVNCCILIILALTACFLSTKIKQERMVFL